MPRRAASTFIYIETPEGLSSPFEANPISEPKSAHSRKSSKKRAVEPQDTPPKRAKISTTGRQPDYKEDSEDSGERSRKRNLSSKRISPFKRVKDEQEDVVPGDLPIESGNGTIQQPLKNSRAKVGAKKEEIQADNVDQNPETQKVKKRRKTKEEKEAEAMPLAARTQGIKLMIGAHVSAAGGVQNAITNAVRIGANSMALFLKSQRKWANPPLTPPTAALFRAQATEHAYNPATQVLPHGSYLVNLAQPDPTKAAQAYDSFLDDLKRCEALGIALYNFHPGNTVGAPRADAIARLAAQLNRAHAATSGVVTLLENMASATDTSNVLGGRFEDLRDIIALVRDQRRVGVTLDTCHAFAAGYDMRSPEALRRTLDCFDKTVGLRFLRALHVNDSKEMLGSGRDLHQSIGRGFLGLRAFHALVNEESLMGLPMVLETPVRDGEDEGAVYAREIKLLESLVGMDPEGEEFERLEGDLAERGKEERDKVIEAHKKREDKNKAAKKKAAEQGVAKDVGKKKERKSDA